RNAELCRLAGKALAAGQAPEEILQAVQWAAEVLPLAFEAEARHAAEAGAGPAPGCPDPGGVPF
ncbi:MAG: hypothetical protein ACK6EB_02285, partial [Planctomyces sp.]